MLFISSNRRKIRNSFCTVWYWFRKFAVENQSVIKKKLSVSSKRLAGTTAPKSSVMSSPIT